jgi:hypothetical protein
MADVAVAGEQFDRVASFGDTRPAKAEKNDPENDHRVEIKLSVASRKIADSAPLNSPEIVKP